MVSGLSHISVHARDVDEAITFWTSIFGAEEFMFNHQPESGLIGVETTERLASVKLGSTVLHFNVKPGISGWDTEYPHFAFTVTAEQLRTLKLRLEVTGVKTHPLWTRSQVEALMYFRDPSGNLFEFFCWRYDNVDELRVDAFSGGDFRPPVDDLRYDWAGPDALATLA
ncbi:hypothetical protein B1964_23325 [Gordonia sp. i37]|nr:hypothetical protein B1964_23325 [Gordonia sp. i37]